eukprot:gene12436-16680_t
MIASENDSLLKPKKEFNHSNQWFPMSVEQLLQHLWVVPIVLLIITITILYIPTYDPLIPNYQYIKLPNAARINFGSLRYEKFVRIDNTQLGQNNLILSESIPWKHGATFEVFRSGHEVCFKLKTMSDRWLKLDYDSGELKASGMLRLEGTYFAAVAVNVSTVPDIQDKYFNITNREEIQHFKLKVCKQNLWFEVRQGSAWSPDDVVLLHGKGVTNISPPKSSRSDNLTIALTLHSMNSSAGRVSSSWFYPTSFLINPLLNFVNVKLLRLNVNGNSGNPDENSPSPLPSTSHEEYLSRSSSMIISYMHVKPVRGVNLGGWFIPEVWMVPSFFAGTGLGWSGSLCRMANYSRPLTEERIQHMLKTWITEADFAEISSIGFDSVRLPIGYWNIIEDPYHIFAPANLSDSLYYIDWAFDMADKYNLTILLDLHGAPGSQNGIDHSGCSMPPTWIKPQNIQLTLQAVEAMAERYSNRTSLLGIEMINEPSDYYSERNHTALVLFYQAAYKVVRKYSPNCLVVFNELYEKCYSYWKNVLKEPEYYNVVVDWHLYDWQLPFTRESVSRHIGDAKGWRNLIDTFTAQHPVIVGEWCMSTGTYVQAGQPFVDSCVGSFERSFGWYLWNWKIERDVHFDEWDVQLQYEKPNGLRPLRK